MKQLVEFPWPGNIRQLENIVTRLVHLSGDLITWDALLENRELFPEVAEARWMSLSEAREIMLASQLPLLDALQEKLKG